MKNYRIIFSDLDGTLLRNDHNVSLPTREKIRQLDEEGIPFVIVSARIPTAVSPIQEQIGVKGPAICFNGGLILDKNGKILQQIPVNKKLAAAVLAGARELCPGIACNLYSSKHWMVEDAATEEVARESAVTGLVPRVVKFEDVYKSNTVIYKVTCSGTQEQAELLERELGREFPDFSVKRSHGSYVEIVPRNARKSLALASLCQLLDIPVEQAVAFGDNFNDVDMLKRAGLGVAMGNAPEEVKLKANRVTWTNEKDGVLYMMNRLSFKAE